MTRADVVALLLAAQGGVCAICGLAEEQVPRPRRLRFWRLDHSHGPDGLARGVVCNGCNVRLSLLEDPALREAALRYLELPPAAAIGLEYVVSRPTSDAGRVEACDATRPG